MKNFFKWLAAITLAGTVVGIFATYFYKTRTDADCEDSNAANEEEFDLDTDLQPVAEREYVSLKRAEDTSGEDSLSL